MSGVRGVHNGISTKVFVLIHRNVRKIYFSRILFHRAGILVVWGAGVCGGWGRCWGEGEGEAGVEVNLVG